MNLETHIHSARLLRSWDIPDSARQVCCIAMREDLALLSSFIEERPKTRFVCCLFRTFPPAARNTCAFQAAAAWPPFRSAACQDVEKAANLEKVILCRPGAPGAAATAMLCPLPGGLRRARRVSVFRAGTGVWRAAASAWIFMISTPAKLQKVYDLLADDAGREAYAGRSRR